MRLITWNVNSIRQRLPRLLGLLERHQPDVVCLQETKVEDVAFPTDELATAGYRSVAFGQKSYNGVAILARDAIEGVTLGFSGNPVPDEARVISGTVDGIHIVCCYVVNGKEVGNPAYDTKLAWLDGLVAHLGGIVDPSAPCIVTGDFNIAPSDADVYDPKGWEGRNLVTKPERDRLQRLLDLGLTDLGRQAAGDVTGPFTFWDYRAGAFHKGWGLRIDLVLGTGPIAEALTQVEVDRDERKQSSADGKPSDHAPVIATWAS